MVAALLCSLCHPSAFFPDDELTHCYGRGDRPALPGVFGGSRCSCLCRPAPESAPEAPR